MNSIYLKTANSAKWAVVLFLLCLQAKAIAQNPVADFIADPVSGCAPLTVYFTDNSLGNPTIYNWDLGNGTISGLKNPVTTYFNPGLYTITLTVTNAAGTATITKTQYIKIYGKPAVDFTVNDSSGCIPLISRFTDASNTSTGNITLWDWDFGDGDTSKQQNPVHNYLVDGSFNVTLKITNTGGCVNAVTKRQFIKVARPPAAYFNFPGAVKCKPPETINFTNASTGQGALTYQWDFGNGTTSTLTNPANTYTAGGSFSVQLIVKDIAGCADTIEKKDGVIIKTVTSLINSADSICSGTSTSFTNNSNPLPIAAKWSFGDNTYSNQINGSKLWSTPGLYTVTLINTYASCTDSVAKQVKVLTVPVTAFSASDSNACNAPFTVNFTDLTPMAAQWAWQFGDGNVSTQQNPSNTYNNLGTYAVKLTVTNSSGCSKTAAYPNYIKVFKPVARIANVPGGGCIPFTFKPVSGSSSAEGINSYYWDLGNGSASALSNPTAYYPSSGNYTIKLLITSNDGCTDSTIVVNGIKTSTKPVVDFSVSPQVQCFGMPVSFTDLSADTIERWLWSAGDSSTSTLQHFQHVYKDTGTFTVKLIAWKNGCSDTVTKVNIVKNKVPVAKFKSTFNCSNRMEVAFTDTSAGAGNWFWDFNDGTTSNLQHPVHVFPTSKTYIVKLTVWNDTCSNTISKPINVFDSKPDFLVTKNNICKNDSAKFTIITASNSTADRYTWSFGDGSAATNNAAAISHKYTQAGFYKITLFTTEANGCFDTIVKQNFIQVFSPKANFSISSLAGCLPMEVTFTSSSTTANGNNNIATWEWNFNDGQIQLVPAFSTIPVTHIYKDSGSFRPFLKITDSIGCSDKFILANPLYVSRPTANFDSAAINTCLNQNVHLTNTSAGKNLSSFWLFGDGTASNRTTPYKSFTTEGDYDAKLIVTDAFGCKDSVERINYFKVKTVIPSFLLDDSTGTCVPFKVSFTNTSQFAGWQSWDFGDGASSTLANPVHSYNDPGIYYAKLTAKRSDACFETISKKIEIYAPSGTIDYYPINGCSPLVVSFNVNTAANVSYTYDFNDGNSVQSTSPVIQHIYTMPGKFLPKVILKDSAGCLIPVFGKDTVRLYSSRVDFGIDRSVFCDSGTVVFADSTISGSTVSSYSWSFGDGNSSGLQNPIHHYSTTGFYNVQLAIKTIYGCNDTLVKTRLVKVVIKPKISLTGNNAFCGPSPVLLQSNLLTTDTAVINWHWQFGNGNTSSVQNPPAQVYNSVGNFPVLLTATNSSGCTDSATTLVKINPIPATNAGNDTTVCLNSNFTLHATGADFYSWQPTVLLSCLSCSNPSTSLADNHTFTVEGVTNAGCKSADTIVVRVKKPFTITKPQAVDTICAGQSKQFLVSGAEHYNWSPATDLSSSIIANPVAAPLATTLYKVIATDSINCFKDSAFINLKVFPKATVNAGTDMVVAYQKPVSINIQNSAGIVKWSWSPPQYLNCTDCANPVATPDFNTTYTVTVSNAAGCTATDEVRLLLSCDKSNLFLPTAFTPNADNLNNIFYPISTGVFKIKSFRIFNRNGELVFMNAGFLPNKPDAGWNGKYKGKPADTGNYMYALEIICNNNNELSFSGNILLIR